jgi:hypothetical protein
MERSCALRLGHVEPRILPRTACFDASGAPAAGPHRTARLAVDEACSMIDTLRRGGSDLF